MKILQGNLTETIYDMPDSTIPPNGPLLIKKETVYAKNQVAYISDKIGLHRVSNPDKNAFAMSLHREYSVIDTYTSSAKVFSSLYAA